MHTYVENKYVDLRENCVTDVTHKINAEPTYIRKLHYRLVLNAMFGINGLQLILIRHCSSKWLTTMVSPHCLSIFVFDELLTS
jgi:hypothetical protein